MKRFLLLWAVALVSCEPPEKELKPVRPLEKPVQEAKAVGFKFDVHTEFPPAPSNMVFDTLPLFSPEDRETLSDKLLTISRIEKIHIYLAVVRDLRRQDFQEFSRLVRQSWLNRDIGGVVVLAASSSPETFIVAGGPEALIYGEDKLRAAAASSIKTALPRFLHGDYRGGMQTTLDEFLYEMRVLRGDPKPKGELLRLEPTTWRAHWARFWRGSGNFKRKMILLAAVGVLLLVAGLIWLIGRIVFNRPRKLPFVEYRHRLGAPYSGGNNIRVDFRKRKQR